MNPITHLNPMYYRAWGGKGEDARHILVWGRMQDMNQVPTNWYEQHADAPPFKVPVVCKGRVAWVSPHRLTILEGDGGMQPPVDWVDAYHKEVESFKAHNPSLKGCPSKSMATGG